MIHVACHILQEGGLNRVELSMAIDEKCIK